MQAIELSAVGYSVASLRTAGYSAGQCKPDLILMVGGLAATILYVVLTSITY